MFVNRIREVVSFELDREGSRERTLTNFNPLSSIEKGVEKEP